MNPVIAALRAEGIAALDNAPLSERPTLRVGGPAKALVEAASAREIALAREIAAAHGQPVLIVGNGSNLLVRDAGFDGVVIHIGEKMNGVRREGDVIHAGAGAILAISEPVEEAHDRFTDATDLGGANPLVQKQCVPR